MSEAHPEAAEAAPAPSQPIQRPDPPSSETIGDLAFDLMRAQYWTLRAHEPGVRCGDDPADLHQMRVAIRRLRAALAVFEGALPARAAVLRERLGRLGSTLGAVRDLDVLVDRVGVWAAQAGASDRDALEALAVALEQRRARARERLVMALGSAGFQRLLNSLELFLARGPMKRAPAARAPVPTLAPELLLREHRRLATLGESIDDASPPEALHALRIRCKRMRYAVEFFTPVYGKPARAYGRKLAALQDALGAHQDAVAATAVLRQIALAKGRRLERERLLAIGGLIERCQRETAAARRRFPKRYRKVVGGPWRRLARMLDDDRARAEEADVEQEQPQ